MSTQFVGDLEVVDGAAVEAALPPFPIAQWLHGDPKLAAAGGVAHTGGVILPLRYLAEPEHVAAPTGWIKSTVAFASGKLEPVLAAQEIRLAVIRTRFRWFVVENGVITQFPRSGYEPGRGMRGHTQALCGVAGFDFPMVVTFKGKASQEFERLLREFTRTIQQAVRDNAHANGTFPRFAFFMPLTAGPHVKVGPTGQEALITPPVLDLPAEVVAEHLAEIYTGRERLIAYQQLFHEVAAWASAWDVPGTEVIPSDDERAPETQQ